MPFSPHTFQFLYKILILAFVTSSALLFSPYTIGQSLTEEKDYISEVLKNCSRSELNQKICNLYYYKCLDSTLDNKKLYLIYSIQIRAIITASSRKVKNTRSQDLVKLYKELKSKIMTFGENYSSAVEACKTGKCATPEEVRQHMCVNLAELRETMERFDIKYKELNPDPKN